MHSLSRIVVPATLDSNRNYSAILTTLQGSENGRVVTIGKRSRLNRQIWYRHPISEAGNDEIQNFQRGDFYFVGITF
jgi:hypothetical protein